MNKSFLVVTIRPWNIKIFKETISRYPGNWYLISSPKELTLEKIKKIAPQYIFFPHWNQIIPREITSQFKCVGFHETNLPYGRGGSPIQNLITRGETETVISAIQLTGKLDAGPIYLKQPLNLEGTAEEIYLRAARLVAKMILKIVNQNLKPKPQKGEIVIFKRRHPGQSRLAKNLNSLKSVFDHIRMLDAQEYPRSFIDHGRFRIHFSNPVLRTDKIEAQIEISLKQAKK